VGVHELAEARVRQVVRGGNSTGENEQGQVRASDREPDERVRQREGALRHHESRQESRRKGIRRRDAFRISPQVSSQSKSHVITPIARIASLV